MENQTEGKFLHDLSNPLAVAQGNVKLILRKLAKDPDSFNLDDVITKLEKASDAFDRVNELITARRSHIINKE